MTIKEKRILRQALIVVDLVRSNQEQVFETFGSPDVAMINARASMHHCHTITKLLTAALEEK